MGDTLVFVGGKAAAVAQVDHVTPANVEVGDVFHVTLMSRSGDVATISFTADGATVQNAVEGLHAAAVAAKAVPTAPWDAVTATEDDAKLILTAAVAGEPFYVVCWAVEGGGNDTQTLTRTASVACAGPKIWSSGANWWNVTDSTWGTIYANGDDVIVPADLAAEIYGETYTATKPDTITIEEGMMRAIGSDAKPLEVSLESQANRTVVLAGNTEPIWLKLHHAATTTVRQAPNGSPGSGSYGLNLTGTNNGKLYVQADQDARSISVAANSGETAEFEEIHCHAGRVYVGANVVKNGETLIDLLYATAGSVVCECNAVTVETPKGSTAAVTYRGGAVTNAKARGGTVHWDTAANITNAYSSNGGKLNFDAGSGAVTVTNGYLGSGYHVTDRKQRLTVTNGWDLQECGRGDGTIDRGAHYTETHAAI